MNSWIINSSALGFDPINEFPEQADKAMTLDERRSVRLFSILPILSQVLHQSIDH